MRVDKGHTVHPYVCEAVKTLSLVVHEACRNGKKIHATTGPTIKHDTKLVWENGLELVSTHLTQCNHMFMESLGQNILLESFMASRNI